MSPFQFDTFEILTFFAVLVRFSVLVSILPFYGDQMIPAIMKIFFSVCLSMTLFPVLVSNGHINPAEAIVWSSTASGIAMTIACEVFMGLIMGFTARLLFESINMGANLAGYFMGFASASIYDPHQESQTQIIAKFQGIIALLIFLSFNGHHLLLQAAAESFRFVGIGKARMTTGLMEEMVKYTAEIIHIALQIAAPMALSVFAVNIVYGIFSKAMPQLNILILSFSISALVGLTVMYVSYPEFYHLSTNVLGTIGDRMGVMMARMSH